MRPSPRKYFKKTGATILGSVGEGVIEFGQELTPWVAESMFQAATGDLFESPEAQAQGWDEFKRVHMQPFMDHSPEMVVGMMPLVLFGAHMTDSQNNANYQRWLAEQMKDHTLLTALGVDAETAREIIRTDDQAGRLTLFQNAKRDPNSDTAKAAREQIEAAREAGYNALGGKPKWWGLNRIAHNQLDAQAELLGLEMKRALEVEHLNSNQDIKAIVPPEGADRSGPSGEAGKPLSHR